MIGDRLSVLFTVAMALEFLAPAHAQPRIPKQEIPADMPADLKAAVERLYSENPTERGDALWEIAKFKQRAMPALPILISLFHDGDPSWGDDEADSVGYVARQVVATALKQRAVPALLKELDHKDVNRRVAAAATLGRIGDRRAVEPLIAMLQAPPDPARGEVIKALMSIGDVRALEPLIESAKRPGGRSQWLPDALRAMGPAALPRLKELLAGDDPYFREVAAQAMAYLRDPAVVDPLLASLDDENREVQFWVAQAFPYVFKQRGPKPLLEAVPRTGLQPEVRRMAILVLVQADHEKSIELLSQGLAEDDRDVQSTCLWLIEDRRITDRRLVEPVIRALKASKDNGVRADAADLLPQFDDPRALDPLIDALHDPTDLVREYSARALGRIGDRRAVEPLIEVLAPDRWKFRWQTQSAVLALVKLGDPRAIPALTKIAQNPNEPDQLRQAAQAAAEKLQPNPHHE